MMDRCCKEEVSASKEPILGAPRSIEKKAASKGGKREASVALNMQGSDAQ